MIITNKYNLPQSIVNAVKNDTYDGPQGELKRISVSTIKDAPRIHFLKTRHWNAIEEDVSDRLWALLGTAVHAILERASDETSSIEERIDIPLDGITISGQPDIVNGDRLEDYKVTSSWSVVFNPNGKKEWEQQLNIYRWLIWKKHGKEIKSLIINTILRDHQTSKVGGKYPPIPFVSINMPIWDMGETEAYLKDRVELFKKCIDLPDDKLPQCSKEEMWDNKGTRTRCERYCPVNKFCNIYKEYRENNNVK